MATDITTNGLIERTGVGNAAARAIGVATSVSVPTRADADARYAPISASGDALTTNPLSQFAATTSAQLAGVLSDETGDGGGFVRANNATLVAPALGTPTVLSLPNATGLPIVAGTTGTLSVERGGSGAVTLTGILKGNGTSAFTAAVSGTDYVVPGAVGTLLDQPAYSLGTANITGDPGAPAFANETKLTLTVTGDLTDDFDTPTGITAPADGKAKTVTLIVKQDGTGGRDLRADTLFSNATNWPNVAAIIGDIPVLTSAAGEEWQVDIEAHQSGATTYYNIYVGPTLWLYDGTYTGTAFTMATAMTTGNGNIWNSIPRFTSASAKTFTITAADIPAQYFLNGKAPIVHFINKGAGDVTVVQGTGMTLDGDLVFAEDKMGSIVFHSATTATVIGGTT